MSKKEITLGCQHSKKGLFWGVRAVLTFLFDMFYIQKWDFFIQNCWSFSLYKKKNKTVVIGSQDITVLKAEKWSGKERDITCWS